MDIHGYPWIWISMDIHRKSVDMDMDMDVKFHIHGNPVFSLRAASADRSTQPSTFRGTVKRVSAFGLSIVYSVRKLILIINGDVGCGW